VPIAECIFQSAVENVNADIEETPARVLGWEDVNLTGDYTWQSAVRFRKGKVRPLRPFAVACE
jgi:hypothetical protein